jgi:hypothetical protein
LGNASHGIRGLGAEMTVRMRMWGTVIPSLKSSLGVLLSSTILSVAFDMVVSIYAIESMRLRKLLLHDDGWGIVVGNWLT